MALKPIHQPVRMRRYLPAVVAVASFLAGATPVAQSLADVARKEEERRKTVKEAGKVYTNKDLGSAPLAPPAMAIPPLDTSTSPAPAGGSNDSNASAVEPAEGEPEVKDQAYWAGRMKELRAQVERDQTLLDAMQSRINALTTDFVNIADPAQRSVIETNRQKALAELERLRKSVVELRTTQKIADLEEEARRANVPPGWLR